MLKKRTILLKRKSAMNEIRVPVLMKLSAVKCFFSDGQSCDFSRLPRPFYILSYINRGNAVFDGRSGKVVLQAGDLLFIPLGETYVSHWYGERDMVCTSVFFTFWPGGGALLEKAYPMQKLCCTPEEKMLVLSLEQMRETDTFSAMSQFYSLLDLVFPRLHCGKNVKSDAPIRNALNCIKANYRQELSVRELAAMCHLSESRFAHLFREIMGMSPIAYKNSVAVSNAVKELRLYPDKSIEDISSSYGFASASYFRRVVKTFTGKSPRQLRSADMI